MLVKGTLLLFLATSAIASKSSSTSRAGRFSNASPHPVRPSCKKAGQKLCKQQCVDVMNDSSHCGNCKTKCTAPSTCVAGVCTIPTTCTDFSQCGTVIDCGPGGAGCYCVKGSSAPLGCYYDAGCSDCSVDSDCTAEPGGVCESGSCCPVGACFYARSTCQNPAAVAKRELFVSNDFGRHGSFTPWT